MCRILTSLVICLLVLPSCAGPELRNDQDRIRTAILSLYTDQILDNLVRATNGLPIIQLDYTNASSNVSVEQTASLSNGLQTTTNSALTLAAKNMLVSTHQTVDTISSSVGANNSNNVALTATPVLTSNMLYDAYLTYLGIPGGLEITDAPPPCGAAHVCKKYCNQYYWVPVERKSEFFDLALITTTQRDRLLITPDKYVVTLLKLDEFTATRTVSSNVTYWTVDADIDVLVPNENGAKKNGGPFDQEWLFDADGVQPIRGAVKLSEYIPHQRDITNTYFIRKVERVAGTEQSSDKYYAIDENGQAWVVKLLTGQQRFEKTNTKTEEVRWITSCGDQLVPNEANRIYYTNKLRVTLDDELFERMRHGGLPMAARVKLYSSRPPSPSTDELLQRMHFRLPQIEVKKQPSSTSGNNGLPCEGQPQK